MLRAVDYGFHRRQFTLYRGRLPAVFRPVTAHHILTYARTLGGGGVERAQLRLARGWLAQGRKVTLVIGRVEGPLAADLPAGIEVIEVGTTRHGALLRGLPDVVAAQRPDIVFCAGNYYTSIALWLKLRSWFRRGFRSPPVVAKMSNAPDRGDHGWFVGFFHAVWLAMHGLFLDHLVAMTPATATAATRATRMSGRVSIIPNPPALPAPTVTLPPLPKARFVLGVGRLVAQKRWDRLIEAFAAIVDPSVALVILGEGEDRAAILAQARALGIGDRLYLPGHVADPMPVMARAALVALTSDYEGVPGALREALAMGTPVVATNSSSAIPEIITDPTLGTIVPRDDPQSLVAALDTWLRPDAIRPAPVPQPGEDSAARYLALFDEILAIRSR